MDAVIHCEPRIAWQGKRARYFEEGFTRAGITCSVTTSRRRQGGMPVLLGTTCWRDIEATGDYLLVDRCSFGDTERYVSLVWNGHGRRGDHRVPDQVTGERWESMGGSLLPWKPVGDRIVLCGQTETYSPHYRTVQDWYGSVRHTHFRPHPADKNEYQNVTHHFDNAIAVTLNSSVGVKSVIDGIPTITMDEGAMAWPVTGHSLEDIRTPDRTEWAWRLAHTQWSDDEIKEGKLWDSLW